MIRTSLLLLAGMFAGSSCSDFLEEYSQDKAQVETWEDLNELLLGEDFSKPKIIFQEIVQESQFFYDTEGEFFCNDTGRIITGKYLPFLLSIFNSKLFFYAVKRFYGGGSLGEDGVRMKHTFFQNFPCINEQTTINMSIGTNDVMQIDRTICAEYGLSEEEIEFIIST